jgi:hypothetical protein
MSDRAIDSLDDVEGHRLATNDDEIVIDEPEDDVEGHLRRATDDDGGPPPMARRVAPDEDDVEGHARRR